jgi:hypothetical protein
LAAVHELIFLFFFLLFLLLLFQVSLFGVTLIRTMNWIPLFCSALVTVTLAYLSAGRLPDYPAEAPHCCQWELDIWCLCEEVEFDDHQDGEDQADPVGTRQWQKSP